MTLVKHEQNDFRHEIQKRQRYTEEHLKEKVILTLNPNI